MRVAALFSVAALLVVSTCCGASTSRVEDEDRFSIPKDLLIGAAVSAIQTEGAAFEDGKAESATDFIVRNLQGKMFTANHFQAADSYHRFQEDVDMAAKLKLKLYKFTMSWSRILPDGNAANFNQKGVDFYHNLIDSIRKKGMTPLAMLYHFDHPQTLQKQFNGWQGRGIIDKFVEYVEYVHNEYGSKVEYWATINEPNMYCSYFNALFAAVEPSAHSNDSVYDCFYNSIMAHKKAYLAIKKNSQYKSQVGFTALFMPARATTTRPEDEYAANVFNQMHAGSILHPVVYGDYPQVVKNLAGSKLTEFSSEDKKNLANSTDFIGLNLYFGMVASYNRFHNSTGDAGVGGMAANPLMVDMNFVDVAMASSPDALPGATFAAINPDSMRDGLLWAHEVYNKPLVICENGFGDTQGLGVKDHQRAAYHSAFLRAVVTTIKDYDVKVLAYSAWSLIDSFEFTAGYGRPFGLVHVDYANGSLNRTLKESSSFWIEMANTGIVPLVLPSVPTSAAPSVPPSDKPSSASTHVASVVLALVASCARWL